MYKRINVHHMYKVRVSGPVKSYTHSRSGVCICRLNNAFYVSPFTAPLGFHPLLSACMTCPQKEFPNVDKDLILLQIGREGYVCCFRVCVLCILKTKSPPIRVRGWDVISSDCKRTFSRPIPSLFNTLNPSHRVTSREDI